MQITRDGIETRAGPSEVVHRRGLPRCGRDAVRRLAPEREQRPLHPGSANGVAHASERPDDLRDRGRRPRTAPRRPDRGHPARLPGVPRAGRGSLARGDAESLHDPSRDVKSTTKPIRDLRRQDRRQVPHARLRGSQPEQDSRLRSAFSGELARAADLDAAEGWHCLEHDKDAPCVARQVAELDVALGDHDLERSISPAKPDRGDVRAAVLALGRQHGRRGAPEQRANAFEPPVTTGNLPCRREAFLEHSRIR